MMTTLTTRRVSPHCRAQAKTCKPCLLLLLALLLGNAASAQQESTKPANDTSATAASESKDINVEEGDLAYRIGRDDLLDIRVFSRPQLSRDNVRVDESGMISMPLIGEVRAACRTEKELAHRIAEGYLEYQRNPQVDVFVREYQSQPIAVIGAVRSPGRFQLRRSVRLLEVLSMVGGPSEKAGRRIQIIHFPQSAQDCSSEDKTPAGASASEETVLSYVLRDTLRGADEANPYLRPGDVVTLLDADQVYVVGNVLSPRPIPLTEQLTVSQAIAIAGGTLPATKSSQVRIVRRGTPGVGKTEIFVDLKAIDKRRADDVALQADDIVDVPVSGGKTFLRSLLGVIAPSVGAMPVRVIR